MRNKTADDIISSHPEYEDFGVALEHGCTFTYSILSDEPPRELHVFAHHSGQQVGSAEFIEEWAVGKMPESANVHNVEVAEDHRGHKIASSMYILAELILKLPLDDFWGDGEQTADARAFWAREDRPFGRRSS